MRFFPSVLALACVTALSACQSESETAQTPPTAAAETATASTPELAPPQATSTNQELRQRLSSILSGSHRSETDRARDAHRHPAETLEFFGVQPDSTVIEISPGGGWYADILAPLLRTHGKYIAAIWDESLPDQPEYYARGNARLREKIAAAPDVFGTPVLRPFNPADPAFGEPASTDFVLTFRNAHNWIKAGTAEAYFKAFYDVLKPGGVLGVVDHRAKGDEATDGSTGYVTEQQIIDLATYAGFVVEGSSPINANPKDGADHPKGVWTLPPSYALGDEDRDKYTEIGESDRMTLKFVKPRGAE